MPMLNLAALGGGGGAANLFFSPVAGATPATGGGGGALVPARPRWYQTPEVDPGRGAGAGAIASGYALAAPQHSARTQSLSARAPSPQRTISATAPPWLFPEQGDALEGARHRPSSRTGFMTRGALTAR